MISTKPHSVCRKAGCNNLTRETYCKEHEHVERERELKRHREYNKERDPALTRFYNSKEWRTLSKHVMATNHYLCAKCSIPGHKPVLADVVDHIIPVQADWSRGLDIGNCQPLCHACHNKKTAEDKGKYKI